MATKGSYDVHIIYNSADGPIPQTDSRDTELSLKVLQCVRGKLDGWGMNCYCDLDALPGLNIFNELSRVTKACKWTIVIITPDFMKNHWANYSGQIAFKTLLTKDQETCMLPIVVSNGTMPEHLDLQYALRFTEKNYGSQENQWEKLRKVLKDGKSIHDVNTEEEKCSLTAQGVPVESTMTSPHEIHLKLKTDISDDMVKDSDEYNNFIEHMKAYVPRGILAGKDTLLDKLDAMETKNHLGQRNPDEILKLIESLSMSGVGQYEKLKKVAELSGNIRVKQTIEMAEQKLEATAPTTDEGLSIDGSQTGEGMDEPDRGPVNGENLPGSTSQQTAGVGTATDVNVSHASSEASVQSVQQQQTGVESLEIDQQASTVTIEASPTVRLCPPSGQNTVHNSSGTSGAGDSSLSSGPPSYSNNTVLHRNGNETAVKEVMSTQNDTDIITPSRVSTVASAPKVANNNGANSSRSGSETNTSTSNTNLSNNASKTSVKEVLSPHDAAEVFTPSHVETVEASAPEAPNKTANTQPGLVSSRQVSLSQDSDLVTDNGVSAVANQQQRLGPISASNLHLDSLAESGYDTSLNESTPGDSIYTDSVGERTPGDGICTDSPGTASGAERNPSSTSMAEEVAANNNSSGTGVDVRGESENSLEGTQKPSEGPVRPESIALGLTQPMSSQAVSSELRPSLPNPLLPGVTRPGPSQPRTAQSGWMSLAYNIGVRSLQEACFNTASYHEGS